MPKEYAYAERLPHAGPIEEAAQSAEVRHDDAPGIGGYVFVPRVGIDAASSIIGDAVLRIANGKSPYPVILADATELAAFKRSIAEYMESNAAILKADDDVQYKSEKGRSKARGKQSSSLAALIREALQPGRIRIIDNAQEAQIAALDPHRSKLYLHGHGKDGADGIYYKAQGKTIRINAARIADQLKKAGLHASYRDVRLLSCHGACVPDEGGPSTGQRVADAMGAAGFEAVEVAAYPGAIANLPKTMSDDKLHRSTVLEGKSRPVRASAVRERFTPRRPT